jgi:hypothetical protein
MTKYIEFPLEGGGLIVIESPEDAEKGQAGFVRAGVGEATKEALEQAKHTFDGALENVRKSSDVLVQKLRSLSDPPNEMEVSFSLKAVGELGNLVVGKGSAEANYTVTLKWKRGEDGKKE